MNLTKNDFVSDYWVGETALYTHPEFKLNYIKRDKIWRYEFNNNPEYLVIFERSVGNQINHY